MKTQKKTTKKKGTGKAKTSPRKKATQKKVLDGVKKEKIAPAGLGDSVQAIAIALGIKRMVDWFNEKTGLDCGCETRRDYLNKRFRYGVMNGLCMTVQEFNAWEEFRMKPSTTIDREDAIMIANLHARW